MASTSCESRATNKQVLIHACLILDRCRLLPDASQISTRWRSALDLEAVCVSNVYTDRLLPLIGCIVISSQTIRHHRPRLLC